MSTGSPSITHAHASAPRTPTTQGAGTVKGRGCFGLERRRIGTPRQTSTNARSVPIETSSPTRCIGIEPPARQTNTPVTTVAMCGVLYFGCVRSKKGRSPSRDIA